MEELVAVFDRAMAYMAEPSVADDPTRRFEPNVWGGDRVFLESMQPALRGDVPILFRASSDWEIRHVILFAEKYPDINAVVVGGLEAWKVGAELAAADIPVVLNIGAAFRPTPDRDESITASYRNAGRLVAAGVKVGFASDQGGGGDGHSRNLPYMAAWSVAFGLPEAAAVRAVTLSNAEILGMGDRMGSIEVGKRADLIITDGSPLQLLTNINHMFVGGVAVDPMNNRHVELYEQCRGRN